MANIEFNPKIKPYYIELYTTTTLSLSLFIFILDGETKMYAFEFSEAHTDRISSIIYTVFINMPEHFSTR